MIKTAEEMRKMTKIVPSLRGKYCLRQIEKGIIRRAKQGLHSFIYYRRGSDDSTVARYISEELINAGYEVSTRDISDPREGEASNIQFTIKW